MSNGYGRHRDRIEQSRGQPGNAGQFGSYESGESDVRLGSGELSGGRNPLSGSGASEGTFSDYHDGSRRQAYEDAVADLERMDSGEVTNAELREIAVRSRKTRDALADNASLANLDKMHKTEPESTSDEGSPEDEASLKVQEADQAARGELLRRFPPRRTVGEFFRDLFR